MRSKTTKRIQSATSEETKAKVLKHADELIEMRTIYIAHPISGDIEGNIEKVKAIVREINLTEPNVVPFAPYLVDLIVLDDSNPIERARGFKNNFHLLKFCDELRIYGNVTSSGMLAEIRAATELGIPIVLMNMNIEGVSG